MPDRPTLPGASGSDPRSGQSGRRDELSLVRTNRLGVLAANIVKHHALVHGHVRSTLEHVLACGEALNEARGMVPQGQWRSWLRENVSLETSTAKMYCRLACYRDELRKAGVDSVQAARDYVQQNGLTMAVTGGVLSDDTVLQIRVMRKQGISQRNVARALGVGRTTVQEIEAGRRHTPKGPSGLEAVRPGRSEITDDMIEGMARWLVEHGAGPLTDRIRTRATEALQAALSYRIQRTRAA